MSLFKMPSSVVNKVEKLMRSFLWEGVEEGKKDHLVRWDLVAKFKIEGGLGVGSLMEKNEVLCAKWLWLFHLEPNSLWHLVIRSKYEVARNGWDANPLLQAPFVILGRIFLLVSIPFYSVDFSFRRNLNERELAEVIKMLDILDEIRLSPSKLDRRWWELEGSDSFSCKSFRSFLLNNGMLEAFPPYSLIWKAKSPPKVKVLVWLVAIGKVNTSDLVQRQRPYIYLSPHWCVLCKMSEESVDDLFLQCPFSLCLWWTL
ncbi:unnamed protein product, partial [Prunus brigantina]